MFSDAGWSGTDDARPAFNRMMAHALAPELPYDMIVVHSLSRFTRDLALQAVSYEQRQVAGVDQVSVTEHQAVGGDVIGDRLK